MIIVPANSTLAAGSDVAAKVTVQVFGKTLNTSTGAETFDQLYHAQLGNSVATIYTAPATGPAFIKTISIVNTDTAARTVTLAVGATTADHQITPAITLQAGGWATYEDGPGWSVYSSTGMLLSGPAINDQGYDPAVMGTAGCKAATHDRSLVIETAQTITTTGQVYMQIIRIRAGVVCANIKMWSSGTGAGTPTHYNAGLYDTSGNRLATGTDKTSTAWGTNALVTFAMQSPYTVVSAGLFYIAYSMVATTCPTLKGIAARTGGQLALVSPVISGVSGTAYATGDMPPTLAIPAGAVTTSMYAEVS